MIEFKALKYQGWAIVWAVIITVLCNIPMADLKGGFFFAGFDKVTHLGCFYVLSVLLFYGKINHQHSYSFSSITIFKVILLSALLGGAIEMLQWKVFTFRSAEWWDFGCDMLGALMGIFSYILLHKSNYHAQKV